jgi:hypothetical protein
MDALESSLESLSLNHDTDPWFAGKHSVEADNVSTTVQDTMTSECGEIQSERARHYGILDTHAGTSVYFNGMNALSYAPDVTHLYPMGPMNLPAYSSSTPEEEARGLWSSSEGLSQYTSPATRLSVYNPVGGGGGLPVDGRSAISSFGLHDRSVNGQICLDQAPFRSVGPDDFGGLYNFDVEPSLPNFVGGQFVSGFEGHPTTMADIGSSPSTRRVRRRSSTKGDLEFKCTKPRCGWTFDTKADLR